VFDKILLPQESRVTIEHQEYNSFQEIARVFQGAGMSVVADAAVEHLRRRYASFIRVLPSLVLTGPEPITLIVDNLNVLKYISRGLSVAEDVLKLDDSVNQDPQSHRDIYDKALQAILDSIINPRELASQPNARAAIERACGLIRATRDMDLLPFQIAKRHRDHFYHQINVGGLGAIFLDIRDSRGVSLWENMANTLEFQGDDMMRERKVKALWWITALLHDHTYSLSEALSLFPSLLVLRQHAAEPALVDSAFDAHKQLVRNMMSNDFDTNVFNHLVRKQVMSSEKGDAKMKYNLVSYSDMPARLRINGLVYQKGYVYKPRKATKAEGFDLPVQDHGYVCYGTRPRATELYDYGPWLQSEPPFFFEVERPIFVRWELLPKEVILDGRKFTKAFDRYYLGPEPSEEQIQFLFDYMAPTYDAEIDMEMNLDVNEKLLERIAEVESVTSRTVKVLDYGVGTGICANARPQVKEGEHYHWEITGLDISRLMLEEAKEKLYSKVDNRDSLLHKVMEVKNAMSSEEEASFDAAMACFTVHYFLDIKPCENIYRFLKPGRPFVCNVRENEIRETENRIEKVGFLLDEDRRTLSHEVRGELVVILTFIKPS